MPKVRYVKPEHVEILRDYLNSADAGAVVLVYPEMQSAVAEHAIEDGDNVEDYNFGGEADFVVDAVTNHQAYFMTHLREQAGDDE